MRENMKDYGKGKLSKEGRQNTLGLRGQGEDRSGRSKWGEEWNQKLDS